MQKIKALYFLGSALVVMSLLAGGSAWSQGPAAIPAPPIGPIPKEGFLQHRTNLQSKLLLGRTIQDEQHRKLGTLKNLLLDTDGKVSHVVLATGGFLSLGEKLIKVPYDHLQITANAIVLPIGKNALETMESYEEIQS